MPFQKTVKNKVTFSGIGLHSGKDAEVTLRPAEAGTGIVFHRTDLTPSVSIEAIAAMLSTPGFPPPSAKTAPSSPPLSI